MAKSYPEPKLKDEHSIRLLHLAPGLWKDEIECSLTAVSLNSQPDYIAISYTWGSSAQKARIRVDDQRDYHVTDNVCALLRRLRHADKPQVLWIDSICINQEDLLERSQQVKIMGQVYSSAAQTLVWLGDTATTSSDNGRRRQGGTEDWQDVESDLDQTLTITSPWWWDRAWVLQELVLSSKVIVCWGPYQKPWGDFCWDHLKVDSSTERSRTGSTYSFNSPHLNMSPTRKHMRERFESMDGLRTRVRVYGRLPFWDVLRYTIESQSTDLRDKVYSILSIVSSEVASLIEPDYEMPYQEVFARATFAALSAEKQFNPLYQLKLDGRQTSLPSWALDFTQGRRFDFSELSRLGSEVRAQWTTLDSDQPVVRNGSNHKQLIVSGVCLDRIAGITRLTTLLYENGDNVVHSALNSILDRLQVSDAYKGIIGYKCPDTSKRKNTTTALTKQSIAAFKSSSGSVQHLSRSAIALWSEILGVPKTTRADLTYENGLFLFWHYAKSTLDSHGTGEVKETAIMFSTKAGFFGIAPSGVRGGDFVVMVRGSRFPMIMRWHRDGYQFCGFAFVYGVMAGELLVMCEEWLFEETEFTLV